MQIEKNSTSTVRNMHSLFSFRCSFLLIRLVLSSRPVSNDFFVDGSSLSVPQCIQSRVARFYFFVIFFSSPSSSFPTIFHVRFAHCMFELLGDQHPANGIHSKLSKKMVEFYLQFHFVRNYYVSAFQLSVSQF